MSGTMIALESAGTGKIPAAVPTRLSIDGGWRRSSDGPVVEVLDSATGNLLANVGDDGITAGAESRAALSARSTTRRRQHGEILPCAFEVMNARSEDVARPDLSEKNKTGPVERFTSHE